MVSRNILAVAGGLTLVVLGLALTLPVASAQPAAVVVVSMPVGAGVGPSAAPGFSPENVTVVIGVNNTVTWTNMDTNNGGTDHTVTSLSVPTGAASFDSGIMKEGANFTQTFTTPGTYEYHCTLHSWMAGSVIVLASTSSTSSTSAPQFPSAALAVTLFAVIAGVILATARLRRTLPASPVATPSRMATTAP